MYKIKRFKRIRPKVDYIIITQSINLIDKNVYIDPMVYQRSYKYTWGRWQEYFMRDLYKPALPCHYFSEFLDKDFVVYKGLPDIQPSYYIEDLVSAGIIEYKYLNSILVVIGENFTTDNLEQRLTDHLSDKVLCPLIRQKKLDYSRIKLLDDCLTENWEINLQSSILNYDIKPHTYFNPDLLDFSMKRYKK